MYNSQITAFDIPDSWFRILKEILDHGYERPVFRGAREGHKRLELDSASIHITNPSVRPLVPTVPDGIPPPTSVDYINQYVLSLMSPEKADWEDYTYGQRMHQLLGVPEDYGTGQDERFIHMLKHDMIEGMRMSALDFNQFQTAMEMLKQTPESNRAMIEIGKPEDLLLKHPPCMRYVQFKVRYERLHIWVYFRSWDAWAGYVSNLPALQLVSEYVAKQLGVQSGEMFAFSAGLHLYDDSFELARQVVVPKTIPRSEHHVQGQ